MNTLRSDAAHLSVATEVRLAEPQIERRAVQLCVRAEPHTGEPPARVTCTRRSGNSTARR